MIKYKEVDGVKCVDIENDTCLAVDIKGWSRIFQYSNRNLVIKEQYGLRLYDLDTDQLVAVYVEDLNKKPVIKKKL